MRRETGDVLKVLQGLLEGVEHEIGGRPERARGAYRRGLDGAGEVKDGAWCAAAYNNLGLLEAEAENFDLAMHHLERSLRLYEAAGDDLGRLITYCNLATVAGASGSGTEAARYRRKSLLARVSLGARSVEPAGGFVAGNLSRLMGIDAWMQAEDESLMVTPPPLPRRREPSLEEAPTLEDLRAFFGRSRDDDG
jgi:tetratricopeptide (TPR) repeat protein